MIKKIRIWFKEFRKYFAKLIFDKKINPSAFLNISESKNILFLKYDNKIGDMAVLSLVFREFKRYYPQVRILVLCGKDNKEIIKYNPYVDEIIEISGKFIKDFGIYKALKQMTIDIAVDFFIFNPRPKHLFAIRTIAPKFLIGFHKQNYKMYDFSINCDVNELHISKRYESLLKELGIKPSSLDYDIFLNPEDERKAKTLFKDGKNNLIINPFAASKHRSFSFEKLQELIVKLKEKKDLNIYVICPKRYSNLLNGLYGAVLLDIDSILESAAFVKYCDYIISPDTSIVHIAAAFKKKMLALFLDYSDFEEKICKVWAPPDYEGAFKVCVDTKNGALENDIKNIDNSLIIEKFINLTLRVN
ncbi:MAG: glycosyltransferase family 9 protein [Endomicrobium sp.]|jgi:ADP-heptose:LPS heptosyltransferase|nr:glycosyltransferase family 9 protein [Endomicrobium sp.]